MPKTRKYQKSNRKTRKTNKTNKTRNKRIKKIKAKKTLKRKVKKQMLGGNGRKGTIEGAEGKKGTVMLEYNGRGDKQLKEELENGGLSELHTACRDGDIATVKILLENPEVDVNKATPIYSMTPLYIASLKNYADVVEELLTHPEIDVSKSTKDRESPLYVAIKKNHAEVKKLLYKYIEKLITNKKEERGLIT